MPAYSYKCPDCSQENTHFRAMSEEEPYLRCGGCGAVLQRNYKADLFSPGHREYGIDIVSHSLAMHPDQIAEHKQRFPDITVRDDGCPIFTHTQQHDKYLKAIGWKKVPGKKRRRSKKLPCSAGNHK